MNTEQINKAERMRGALWGMFVGDVANHATTKERDKVFLNDDHVVSVDNLACAGYLAAYGQRQVWQCL